ncbi:MAG TPA: ferritin [Solirubrobacteraceae bacterium]
MPAQAFVDALNEQIAEEFAASQQYVAIAVNYDAQTLPRLAAFFYRQALEERNHAMMMVQYLLDAGADPVVPGVAPPETAFSGIVAPVALALDQERRVADQVSHLAAVARQEGDYASEQFMSWFIKEQVEEIASMSALLTVVTRSQDDPQRVEEYLAREHPGAVDEPAGAPAAAGGAL